MGIFDGSCISMAGANAPSPKKRAKYENQMIFKQVFTDFKNTALHRYHFNGLPDTVSERVLKESLLYYGTAVFFEKNGAVLALPGRPAYDPTMYGDFRYSYVYGANGFNALVALEIPGGADAAILAKGVGDSQPSGLRGVLVREAYDFSNPFVFTAWNYATRVADAVRSLDVAVRNGKTPGVWLCAQSEVESIRRFNRQMEDNQESIITSGFFPIDKVRYQPLAQDSLTHSQNFMQIVDYWKSAFKEACGIDNLAPNTFKKANLLSDEVGQNDQYTSAVIDKTIDVIQEGLDFANSIFGLDMHVERYKAAGKGEEPAEEKAEGKEGEEEGKNDF